MQDNNWISIDAYVKMIQMDKKSVEKMIEQKELDFEIRDGTVFIDASSTNINTLIPKVLKESNNGNVVVQQGFVEKTITTLLNLHDKVLVSKDETIVTLKDENTFLKEALYQMQELYSEDRKTIETISEQLKLSQSEVTFLRRKYKLMWGKVVEDYANPKKKDSNDK